MQVIRQQNHSRHLESQPLTDLANGDLIYNVDFRSVYAAVLEDWMGAPSQQVLGRAYRKAVLFKPRV